jgi:NACHT domain/CHAT domain
MSKLLILSSNPRRDLNLDREISDLNNALQRLGKFEISLGLGVRAQELSKLIAEHNPEIVHFSGHGAGVQGLVFQDEDGQEQLVSTEVLARIFETFAVEINCTVLNACDSDRQAEAIVEHINYVIGMSQPILDKAAHLFSVGFYQGLGSGKSIEQAYEMGCIAIQIWSETNSQSTQSEPNRKLEYAGEIVQPTKQIPEYQKPVILKKIANSVQADPTRSSKVDRSPEFVEFIRQEIDRKEYKDNARVAYDNFGQFSVQNAANLAKSEYAQRKILLGKVKQFWIEGFLQPSLQGAAALPLGVIARQDAIADLTQGCETLVELDPSYERLKKTRIYAEMGKGRTLLILGSPGAGKTIALLQLAQRLIERSEQNLNLPIPVVFNLSSWARDRKSIVDWAIDELREKYQVPQSLSEPWIRQQQLIFLLDGLDEVDADHRNDCVRAVNEFISLFPQIEVAVCSRVKDYEALTERLQISSALCLQPLTSEQVYAVLDSGSIPLTGLKTLLKNDAELEQFARTPLILNFMKEAYTGWSVQDLIPHLRANPDRDRHLFDTYIDKRLAQGSASAYSKDRAICWLSWLANRLLEKKRTIFLIEKMQPNWLRDRYEERIYRIKISVFSGLVLGLIDGLAFGLVFRLIDGLFSGLIGGLIFGLITGLQGKILPVETLRWSWQMAKSKLLRELFIGVSLGLIAEILTWLTFGRGYGLTGILIIGLIFVLGSGLGNFAIEQRTFSNQGIRSSLKNCLIIGSIGGLIGGIIFGSYGLGYGLSYTIVFGLIVGLKYGGIACIQHLILRQVLYQKGYIPWNYAKFLDFATDRLLMKKVGGGYVFFHRMLLEHFARMSPN